MFPPHWQKSGPVRYCSANCCVCVLVGVCVCVGACRGVCASKRENVNINVGKFLYMSASSCALTNPDINVVILSVYVRVRGRVWVCVCVCVALWSLWNSSGISTEYFQAQRFISNHLPVWVQVSSELHPFYPTISLHLSSDRNSS